MPDPKPPVVIDLDARRPCDACGAKWNESHDGWCPQGQLERECEDVELDEEDFDDA